MVTEIVTLNSPKSPESRQVTAPPSAILLSACWKVAQGEPEVQGLESRPLCETYERKSCAWAGAMERAGSRIAARTASEVASLLISSDILIVLVTLQVDRHKPVFGDRSIA
jgi:hypothetical protein